MEQGMAGYLFVHFTGEQKDVETFQVDCQIGALRCHTSALLCKSHNYSSYYNKSLRCFQEIAQQLLAMQKNTDIFQCEA